MLRLRTPPEGDAGGGKANGRADGKVRRRSSRVPEVPGESWLTSQDERRKLFIRVNVPSPSPNQWVFKSWREYHKIKQNWLRLIYEASIQHSQFGQPMAACSLEVQRQGIRELDHDNLVGGLKPLIDSMVKLGFLADDTSDVIQITNYHQVRVPKKTEQCTLIILRELDGRDT